MAVKSFDTLPFETLFKMAEEKYESLEYEEAEYFYGLAYAKNPHDEMLVLCFANLLKTTQKEKEAQMILERSINEVPAGSYKRYLELAEIYQGVKSIQTFERGIEEARKCIANPFKSVAPEAEIKRDIAQAYAGIAEVCMTDLLQEKEAEAKCKEAMEKGLKFDSSCIDVHLQIANYLMWKDDFDRAKGELLEVHRWIMEEREEYDTEAVTCAGKYLIEVEEYAKSLQLFEKLHEDASSELETIYMLAYCSFKLEDLVRCEEYLDEYDQGRLDGQEADAEIEEAVAEMKVELANKKREVGETGEDEEGDWMDVEDEEHY